MSTVALIVIAALVSRRAETAPTLLVSVTYATIAAGLVLGLDDDACYILRPLPTTARRRLAHRLLVLALLAALQCAVLVAAASALFEVRTTLPGLVPLVAVCGVGVAAWATIRTLRPDDAAEWAAGVVMLWLLYRDVVPVAFAPDSASTIWIDHPWLVLAAAVALVTIGTRGREA